MLAIFDVIVFNTDYLILLDKSCDNYDSDNGMSINKVSSNNLAVTGYITGYDEMELKHTLNIYLQ